ncbi:ATP/GTP-binding protein [Ralstonia solanacearum species complex bacterium KE056]|uniref:ATP/GTP-binding protein n=1 Tax=Ralstonia solanacearum species complex bacterium KE056 TaxID=3119585 RepID=UPI002FC34525
MRIAVTGTYSSGTTLTSLALGHYLSLPRTQARMSRQIMPEVVPGKTLEECTSPELIQMVVTRHMERVIHEHDLTPNFVSDGCSLQEWAYGIVRVKYGVNPNASSRLGIGENVPKTEELAYLEAVMQELGKLFKRHVKKSFDVFIHLHNELPLAKDGHRPVNEHFRSASDELLKKSLENLEIPYHVIGGSLEERLEETSRLTGMRVVMPAADAIEKAQQSYSQLRKPAIV